MKQQLRNGRSVASTVVLTAVLGSLLGMTPQVGRAQLAYPMLMSLHPVAARVGQTSEHVLKSRYNMAGAFQVLVSGTGVKGEVLLPETKPGEQPNLQEVKVRFTVAPDAPPGVRDFRLGTPQGASTIGQLVIVSSPIAAETTSNESRDQATEVAIPSAVCGRIEKDEDVDWYKFRVQAGQAINFHVRSQRLQDRIHDLQTHIDPIVSVRNAAGTTLASNDNYFAGDPFIHHRFAEAGEYYLEIRDVRYKGNQYWEYCLELSDQPFITQVSPLAIGAGQTARLQFVGYSLPTNAATYFRAAENGLEETALVPMPSGGHAIAPMPVVISRLPVTQETATPNDTPASAPECVVPTTIAGSLDKPGDVDYFAFVALKGETLAFEVVARRHQSALDAHLRVLSEKGEQLAQNDDARIGKRTTADSAIESWTAPATGRYVVELRDLHGRGGEPFVYALHISRAEPAFRLWLDTDKTQLTPGTSSLVYVRSERRNGFSGEIQLAVTGVPPGVTAACGRILADGQDGCIVYTAEPTAPLSAANLTITGTATHIRPDGRTVTLQSTALPYQEIYQPGGGRGHWPVEMYSLAVGAPADIRAVKLNTYEIALRPGESRKIEVELERAEGFDKNVTLDVNYNHLEQVHADSLPKGVKIDRGQSQTLLTGKNSRGVITLTAAKDAKPVQGQLSAILANVSLNFVMKATYSSRPLVVTVLPAPSP